MAGTYNLSFTAGDTVEFEVLLQNNDETPKDLTGFTAKAQIRVDPTATATLADFEVVGDLDETGSIRLRLESTQTEIFRTTAKAVWDLEILETATSTKTTVLGGTVKAAQDVTRD